MLAVRTFGPLGESRFARLRLAGLIRNQASSAAIPLHSEARDGEVRVEITARGGSPSDPPLLGSLRQLIKSDGFINLPGNELVKVLGKLSRSRTRIPEMFTLVMSTRFESLAAQQQARMLRHAAELDIHVDNEYTGSLVGLNLYSLVDLAVAEVLKMPQSSKRMWDIVYLLAERIFKDNDYKKLQEFLCTRPRTLRDLRIVELATRYVYPVSELDDVVDKRTRDFLAAISTLQIDPRRDMTKARRQPITDSVSNILFDMSVGHSRAVSAEPLLWDISENDAPIIWSCNSMARFYRCSNQFEKTAYYRLQETIASRMGLVVLNIPYWHCSRLTNASQRLEYCAMQRDSALRQLSASRDSGNTTVDGLDNPELFKVPRVSPSSDLPYVGETFFEKERPKRWWAWKDSAKLATRVSI